jgi:hypothetical protein
LVLAPAPEIPGAELGGSVMPTVLLWTYPLQPLLLHAWT